MVVRLLTRVSHCQRLVGHLYILNVPYAYSVNDVLPLPSDGGLSPARKILLTPRYVEVSEYNESRLMPPSTDPNGRADISRRLYGQPLLFS